MVAEVLTLTSWEKQVFIGGWKSSRWKKHEIEFGHKFGGAKLQDGWFSAKPGIHELQAEYDYWMVRSRTD
jgi:hypothetical protein